MTREIFKDLATSIYYFLYLLLFNIGMFNDMREKISLYGDICQLIGFGILETIFFHYLK